MLLGLFEFLSLVSDYPKLPPVKEQLELWSSHGVVVSAHGAGLMNLLLMPQMSAVVEVFPVHFHHNLYQYLAALTGVGHYPVHVTNGSAMWSLDKVTIYVLLGPLLRFRNHISLNSTALLENKLHVVRGHSNPLEGVLLSDSFTELPVAGGYSRL
jgi:hypothetical protein